jgi:hypothetical protein
MRPYGMDDRAEALAAIDYHGVDLRHVANCPYLGRHRPNPGRSSPKPFWALNGAVGYAPTEYRRRVLDFFGKYLPLTPS